MALYEWNRDKQTFNRVKTEREREQEDQEKWAQERVNMNANTHTDPPQGTPASWIGRTIYRTKFPFDKVERLIVFAESDTCIAALELHQASIFMKGDIGSVNATSAFVINKLELAKNDPDGVARDKGNETARYFADGTQAAGFRTRRAERETKRASEQARQQSQREAQFRTGRASGRGFAFDFGFSDFQFNFNYQRANQPPNLPKDPSISLLGLSHPFTPDDVKKAYRKKAQEVHPDKPGGSNAAFVKLGEARDAALRLATTKR